MARTGEFHQWPRALAGWRAAALLALLAGDRTYPFDAAFNPLPDEIVVDRPAGRRLISPNDVVVKRDGTIWFTDAPYGIASDREGYKADSELGEALQRTEYVRWPLLIK